MKSLNKIILHIDNCFCRISTFILSFFSLRVRILNDEFSVYRYLKREYNHIRIQDYPTAYQPGDTIWTFWAQGFDSMPPKIRACYDSILRNKGNYKVVLLDLNNIDEYLNIPERIDFLVKSGKMTLTHFSDYIRIAILEKYGGWYIDTTLFVTREVPTMQTLFTIRLLHKDGSVPNGKWCGFLWYMPQGHPLSKYALDFLNDYWNKNDSVILYFLIDHIIHIFYDRCKSFRNEMKMLPYSCPNLMFLQSEACTQKFDATRWDRLVQDTLFMKNNWRTKLDCKTQSQEVSYFGYVFGKYYHEY